MPRRLLVAALALGATSGCFALFSLDGYGPPAGDAGADEASVPVDAEAPDAGNPRVVFITAARYAVGNQSADTNDLAFDSAEAADAFCQVKDLPGTFRAWVRRPNEMGRSPLPIADLAAGPIVLTDGTVVAASYRELLAQGPRVPIALTATKERLATASIAIMNDFCAENDSLVWTGLTADGGASSEGCTNWSESSGSGLVGYFPTIESGHWTNRCKLSCERKARLYCFQQ